MSRRHSPPDPDPDATLPPLSLELRPMPGWRRTPPHRADPTKASGPLVQDLGKEPDFQPKTGFVMDCALPVLMLVPKLRAMAFRGSVDEIRDQLAGEVLGVQNRALKWGLNEQQAKSAGCFLCSLLDETVVTTPWGRDTEWERNSVLFRLHKETRGGERFFQILAPLLQEPSESPELIELAHMCLRLGFEGKYRQSPDGPPRLAELREKIQSAMAIRGYPARVSHDRPMRGEDGSHVRVPATRRALPWAVVAVVVVVLLSLFTILELFKDKDRGSGLAEPAKSRSEATGVPCVMDRSRQAHGVSQESAPAATHTDYGNEEGQESEPSLPDHPDREWKEVSSIPPTTSTVPPGTTTSVRPSSTVPSTTTTRPAGTAMLPATQPGVLEESTRPATIDAGVQEAERPHRNIEAKYNEGVRALKRGECARAVSLLREVVALDPKDREWRVGWRIGEFYPTGKLKEAEQQCTGTEPIPSSPTRRSPGTRPRDPTKPAASSKQVLQDKEQPNR